MAAYAIMRCKKLAKMGNVAASLKHAYRERETPNADASRTPDNEHRAASSTDEAMGRIRELLPDKRRKDALQARAHVPASLVLYEAAPRLTRTLAAIGEILPGREVAVARELTKLHEEITKTTIGEAVRYYEQNDPRGEYVLVMAGAPAVQAAAEEVTLPDAVATARLLMAQGTPPAAAAKQAAKGTPFSKGDIYKELIAAKDEDDREEESE